MKRLLLAALAATTMLATAPAATAAEPVWVCEWRAVIVTNGYGYAYVWQRDCGYVWIPDSY